MMKIINYILQNTILRITFTVYFVLLALFTGLFGVMKINGKTFISWRK